MSTPPTISLVVLYYEQPNELKRLLDALARLNDKPDEVIIMDDHSTRDPVQEAQIGRDNLSSRLVRNPQNLGPVGAMNVGLTQAAYDYVHFLACDDSIDENFYVTARKNLSTAPETGIYSTNTRLTDNSGTDLGVQALPQPTLEATFLPARLVHDTLYDKGSWFAGNATLFSTKHLRNVDGFDETLMEFADAFACYALGCKWGAFFEPQALAWKHDPVSGRNMTIYQDRTKSRTICNAVIGKMSTDFRDSFSPRFVQRFGNRWRYNERALRFFASNAAIAGNATLSPIEMLAVASLFLIYRPGEFIQKLKTKLGSQFPR